jgi:hypothetical protein
VDMVDSEQVFGQDGGLIEQVFPSHVRPRRGRSTGCVPGCSPSRWSSPGSS